MAIKNMLVLGGAKGHIVGIGADPKGTLEAPKGTVPFGKGLTRTLVAATAQLQLHVIKC